MPAHVAIIPRDGNVKDIRWFRGTPQQAMMVHTTNARTEGSKVILDAPVAGGNFHPYFPSIDGSPYDTAARHPTIRRWTFDLNSKRDTWQEEILFDGMKVTSFVRMDDRYLTHPFRYSYMMLTDPSRPLDEKRFGNLAARVSNLGCASITRRARLRGSSRAPRTASPSRSSFRAAKTHPKATATSSAPRTTSRRCARTS